MVCDECKKTFKQLHVDLEIHMQSHKKPKSFNCKICDKSFHLKWRLRKHTAGHDTEMRYYHYYNNGVECPFEKIGCMFSNAGLKNLALTDSASIDMTNLGL